jgi:hypothetical protein
MRISEHDWQAWFMENDWIFGSDFVRVIDDRRVDVENIAKSAFAALRLRTACAGAAWSRSF